MCNFRISFKVEQSSTVAARYISESCIQFVRYLLKFKDSKWFDDIDKGSKSMGKERMARQLEL